MGRPLQYHLTETVIDSAQHAKIFGATIADKVLFTTGLGVAAARQDRDRASSSLISMTTTYLTVRQSMKRGMMPTGKDSPMGQSQKLMAYIMPLFALTGLYWQFGLVLYWVTTNLWTLGQQYVLLRKYPVGAAAMGPDGNVPIGGKAGKPATASGLTGRTTKPKPAGTRDQAAGDRHREDRNGGRRARRAVPADKAAPPAEADVANKAAVPAAAPRRKSRAGRQDAARAAPGQPR